MTKPKTARYLVVLVPAPPAAPIGIGSQGITYSMTTEHITTKTVEATSAKEAAERAGVSGGATAHVCKISNVQKFKRPVKADLEAV